jgi:hypothetical protein
LTSPVVLLEYIELAHPRKRRKRRKDGTLVTERATTIWWYKLLVSSTQRAGPTFIKVCLFVIAQLFSPNRVMMAHPADLKLLHLPVLSTHSWPNGLLQGLTYFQRRSVNILANCTRTENLIRWHTRVEFLKKHSIRSSTTSLSHSTQNL